jgi:hypothetical protein
MVCQVCGDVGFITSNANRNTPEYVANRYRTESRGVGLVTIEMTFAIAKPDRSKYGQSMALGSDNLLLEKTTIGKAIAGRMYNR